MWKKLTVCCAVLAGSLHVGLGSGPQPAAAAGPTFVDGDPGYVETRDCAPIMHGNDVVPGGWNAGPSYSRSKGFGAMASQQIDPEAAWPKVGDVFYVRLTMATFVQICDPLSAAAEFSLPAGVGPAISTASPIQCLVDGRPEMAACPRTLDIGSFDEDGSRRWALRPPTANQRWHFERPADLEVWVPVAASGPVAGDPVAFTISPQNGNDVETSVSMTVFPASADTEFVSVSGSLPQVLSATSVRVRGFASGVQAGDRIELQYSTQQDFSDLTPVTVQPSARLDQSITALRTDREYWFRYVVTPSDGGQQRVSWPQRIATPAQNTVVVSGCADDDFDSQVSGVPVSAVVVIDCGWRPTAIQLTQTLTPASGVTINGVGLVTLRAPVDGTRAFQGPFTELTIENLTITGANLREAPSGSDSGYPKFGCGGAIRIDEVVLRSVNVVGNRAASGGGVCARRAVVIDSIIAGNVATLGDGGGVSALDSEVSYSEFVGNVAVRNGGGLDAKRASVDQSALIANVAGQSGGGASLQQARLRASSVSGNRATTGAALTDASSEQSSTVQLSRVTIAGNVATQSGGAALSFESPVTFASVLLADNLPASCEVGEIRVVSTSASFDTGSSCGLTGSSGTSGAPVRLGELGLKLSFSSRVTPAYAIRSESAGIDSAEPSACFDQRGSDVVDGDGDGNARCDAGAFELVPGDFQAAPPRRFLDTRSGQATSDGQFQGIGAVEAGQTLRLTVAGRGGVAKTAQSVTMNLTAVNATGSGFVTAFACDQTRPNTANVNVRPGAAWSSAGIVRLAADGSVCLYASTTTDIVVDVSGVVPSGSGYVPVGPARLVDTRPGSATIDGVDAGGGRRAPGTVTQVRLAGRGGLSGDGNLGSVALSVVAVAPSSGGFVTVYDCAEARPNAATLNFQPGQTIANSLIAGRTDGTICIYNSAEIDLVVDVAGSFSVFTGQFNGIVPARLIDSRSGAATVDGREAGAGLRPAGTVTKVPVAGRAGVSVSAEAATINVVAVGATANGYLAVFPCGDEVPSTSSINYRVGAGVGNAALVELGNDGSVCVYNSSPVHVIVDVNGYVNDGFVGRE